MSETNLLTEIPAPGLVTVDGRRYPLRRARLSARAEGGIAFSTLTQEFANPYAEPLEVEYTLPLPVDGAVLSYTIRVGDRVIRSEVEPRDRAEKAYRDALFQGRTAGLLEQARPDTFTQRLGNVPPRTPVEVAIDVLHPLAYLAAATSQWEYRFPTVVGVRYLGMPGQTPDAAALSPDRDVEGGIPARIELSLAIAGAVSATPPVSPSHEIVATHEGDAFHVGLCQGGRLDRDIVVRWNAGEPEVGLRAVEGRGLPGDEGRYALVTLVPPAAPRTTLARDLTVLIDASGSMTGRPLDLARHVVESILCSLGAGDRFELIAFASGVDRLTRGLVAAGGRNLERALRRLRALQASGATDMLAGISEAMRADRPGAQRQVILVTDGQIGFEHEVVSRVADEQEVRLHAVGVGSAVNRSLTQQAAFAGRGIELLVTDETDARTAAARLLAATAGPILTQLRVAGPALRGAQVARLHDLFAGKPLLFTVELGESGGPLELSGKLAEAPWRHRIEVPPTNGTATVDGSAGPEAAGLSADWAQTPMPLGALHGRALVAELELDRGLGLRVDFEPADLRGDGAAQVEECALRHRIASSRTSLVAIAEEPSVDPRAARRRERLAVELPAAVSAEGVGLFGVAQTRPSSRGALKTLSACFADTASQAAVPFVRNLIRRGRDADGKFEESPELWPSEPETVRAAKRREIEARRHRAFLEQLERRVAEAHHRIAGVTAYARWLDQESLLIDLPVPAEGMVLTDDDAILTFTAEEGVKACALEVDLGRSTPREEYPEGVILHLVLCVPRDLAPPPSGEATIEVSWVVCRLGGRCFRIPMRIVIPERPDDPESGGTRAR